MRAIDEALERSRARLQLITRIIALQERYESLSARERQIMGLVAAGRLNKQVGVELGISEITVKAPRGKVMRKMHARSLAELVGISASLSLDSPARQRYRSFPVTAGPVATRHRSPDSGPRIPCKTIAA
jgi:FixJ family two-component response regulator